MTKRGQQATADSAVREGFALHQAGDLDGAEVCYRRALKRDKHHADALYLLGSVQVQKGQSKRAEKTLRAALSERPNHPETLHNLARVLMDLEQFIEAKPLLEKAITVQPDQPSFLRNLGVVHLTLGDSSVAVDTLEKAVSLDHSSAEAWCDLGLAYSQIDRDEKATVAFEKALALDPNHARARHNRGHVRLRQKEFASGWGDYEARRLDPKAGFEVRPFDLSEWNGEDIADTTLLVWGEQGLGDHILYAGMFEDLTQRTGHVVFECEPRLVPLINRSFPDMTVVPCTNLSDPAIKEASPKLQSPIGSLGRWLRSGADSFPRPTPYLVADEQNVAQVTAALVEQAGNRIRIGVSWKSARAGFGTFKSSDLVADWTPVFDAVPDAVFVSLQYGDVREDLENVERKNGLEIHHNVGVDVSQDLDGLAALISSLDLVVTTSNTTAHLAGALGVPTWVLVPRGPARLWYWFDGETNSPWYPSVTLYWQDEAGQWRDPMNRVAHDLQAWIRNRQSEETV